MQPDRTDGIINAIMAFSGCFALFLAALDVLAYSLTEGKRLPHAKQMAAAMAATVVFVLSGIVKLVRWLL